MYSQDNSIFLRELLGKEIGAHIIKDKYFDFIKSENSCWPNVMFNLNLQFHEIDDFITHVKTGIAQGRFPDVLVTEIHQQEDEILKNLKKRDFKVGHWSVMQHDLKKIEPIESSQLKVKRVNSAEELSLWMRICEEELMKGKMDAKMFTSHLNNENTPLFLGYENEYPVTTSLIYLDKKESGLYFIATDLNHRGKGYGKAITHHALDYAKNLGCQIMNLEATDLGLPVYESVGFINYGPVLLINFAKPKQ